MCEKLKYCARNIDPCLREYIKYLRETLGVKPISSCCGHGKYPPTIVMRNPDNSVFEIFSQIDLKDYNPRFDKRHNNYYKRDKEGYYYIPEIMKAKND